MFTKACGGPRVSISISTNVCKSITKNECCKATQNKYYHEYTESIHNAPVSKGFWTVKENRANFLEWMSKQLNIRQYEDWYEVDRRKFYANGGGGLLHSFKDSLYNLLRDVHPSYPWKGWLFHKVPNGFWEDRSNIIDYLQWAASHLQITRMEQWYSITANQLASLHGSGLLTRFQWSLYGLLSQAYPDYPWKPWLFKKLPPGWTTPDNIRQYLEWVGKELKVTSLEDWHRVSTQTFIEIGGPNVINACGGSLLQLLRTVYPDHPWKCWLFGKVPHGFWNNPANIISFFQWFEKELNIKHPGDWYAVPKLAFTRRGAGHLIQQYQFEELLTIVYGPLPQLHVDQEHWNSRDNVFKFLSQVSEHANVRQLAEWYQVSPHTIQQLGGSSLLERYEGSMHRMMSDIYPDYHWKPWLFKQSLPMGYWDSPQNQMEFLEWLSHELEVTEAYDWARVTYQDIVSRRGGKSLLSKYGNSPFNMFSTLFPHIDWSEAFGRSSYLHHPKSQKTLVRVLEQIFPNQTIITQHKDDTIVYSASGKSMEMDVFIPSLQLAFEYQGVQHYQSVPFTNTPLEDIQSRDAEKKAALEAKNITLVAVPHWWDKSKFSLAATILSMCPHLASHMQHIVQNTHFQVAKPIPESPKPRGEEEVASSGLGLLLAQTYHDGIDPSKYWMSEKYDGIRAYWDGTKFLSRNLQLLKIPQDIISQMPSFVVDGEIWFGPNTVQESMKIVHRAKSIDWMKFKYMLFDAPYHPGTFEERYQYLIQNIPQPHPFLQVIPITQCQGRHHLKSFMEGVLKRGGEGVMLRESQSKYITGRSSTLLKVKPYRDDDAIIVGGSGSSWFCKLPNGIVFSSSLKKMIQEPITIGSVVRFQHSGYFSTGRPKRPWILSLRTDLTPQQILLDYYKHCFTRSGQSACSCCHRTLQDGEPRIQTRNILEGDIAQMHLKDVCLHSQCVESLRKEDKLPSVIVPQGESVEGYDVQVNWVPINNFLRFASFQ